jgi:hypothetical protein
VYHAWKSDHAVDVSFAELAQVPLASDQPTMNLNVDPMLDNTGHLIVPGSPCIDKGTDKEAPDHDMDGAHRPHGNAVDIGADETP